MRARLIITLNVLLLHFACSSNEGSPANRDVGGSGGKSSGSGGKSTTFGGGPAQTGPLFAGAECPTNVGFSDVHGLPNVKGAIDGSNVRITFDPQGDARDYRVYALPAAGDVSGDVVAGATYRCAGNTALPFPAVDDSDTPQSAAIRTRVDSVVKGYARKPQDATLGYVYTTPSPDRLPVYVLGDSNVQSDNVSCYFMRWPESRVKKYTTSEAERTQLLAKRWRDDGIAFYVPKPGAPGTEIVYSAKEDDADFSASLYVRAGAEYDERSAKSLTVAEAFSVYTEAEEGAEPLMRVFYDQVCGRGHDELAAGLARFTKAYQQGAQPVTELHYSGLTEETTLVVEALDELCPFQGIVAPTSRPARSDPHQGFTIDYPAFQTPAELGAASATGEIFINGQGSDTAPRPIARACLKVAPETPPKMDFRYDGAPETYSEPVGKGFQIWELESPTFNVQFHTVATDQWSVGSLFGELWVTYADVAADTNGKLRITPKERATLAAETFVHASMEVDTISTQRRYPQLMIGDVEWPVQDNLAKGSTVLVQTFGGISQPVEVQIQFCDHRSWDVNDQCPIYSVYTLNDGQEEFLSPLLEINGLNGLDRTVRFDAYVSTARVYLYTNGVPYACVDLPSGRMKEGPGTVTFADVLYHSGADLAEWYPFHLEKLHYLTSRHFSNLAFSSNVPAPNWDESRVPCVPSL